MSDMEENYKLLDFDILCNLDILQDKQLIIWGAGVRGVKMKRTLVREHFDISCICDSDCKKWGSCVDETEVISPYRLKKRLEENPDIIVISCIMQELEMVKIMQELEMPIVSLVSYWGILTTCIAKGISLEQYKDSEIYDGIWRWQEEFLVKKRTVDYLKNMQSSSDDAIWILQPGKVASMTTAHRLQRVGIPCVQGHNLRYPMHILNGRLEDEWNRIIREKTKRGIKIVTSVREPLARDYSLFWQRFTMELGCLLPIFSIDFQKMYCDFVEMLLKGYDYTCSILKNLCPPNCIEEFEWFDRQLKGVLGVDIYQHPFNREKGYQIIRESNVEIFLFKVEKMQEAMPALSRFVGGVDALPDENDNVAEEKLYGLAYKEFRKNVKLPQAYVEHYYKDNPYMDHFYTEEEKEGFLERWKRNIEKV